MKSLSLVRSVLRKDLQILWPLAVLTTLLIVLAANFLNRTEWSAFYVILEAAKVLACIALIVSLIHEDAVVSFQHDWLIRPVPGASVLFAKCLFVIVGITVPFAIGNTIAGLRNGYSLAESLMSGVGLNDQAVLLPIYCMAFAAVTANFRHAAMLLVVVGSVSAVVLHGVTRVSNNMSDLSGSGADWIVDNGILLLILVLSIVVLWLQYVYRKTFVSYGLAIGCGLAIVVTSLLPWSSIYALQKKLSVQPALASDVRVEVSPGCFTSRSLNSSAPSPTGSSDEVMPAVYRNDATQNAGVNPIAFATGLKQTQFPPNTRLLVNHVEATFLDRDQQKLHLRPAQPYPDRRFNTDGKLTFRHYWLLPRSSYSELVGSQNARLQLDYSMSLLGVERSIEIVADGTRAHYEGLGYCGATVDAVSGEVRVNCLVVGEQPALLIAQIVGEPESSVRRSRNPNYIPTTLDLLGGRRHFISLLATSTAVPLVKITSYEALAHFDRSIVVPGILGGSPEACPAPNNNSD